MSRTVVKDARLSIRLPTPERQAAEVLAARDGVSLNDLVRMAIREYADRREIHSPGLVKLLYKDERKTNNDRCNPN